MGKRILIVDDAMFMRKLMSDILKKAGYEIVAEAGNGEEAFAKYKEFEPDLVTMDITMPDVNGIEGVKMITSSFPDAKVLMCSAMGQEGMVIDSVKAGAKGFIVKPFVAEKVIAEVQKLIG
ncbi:response regulator [Fusibacter ferrireducens]|uniref:Stage 0 sporulation protein A homolog n=1 Tax=Fusibacter ferrireducens TaxID=2785058 RepID=A0ABR9ZWL3_9FIRM|nr:response regulator [Fusibacter ferrireducens]MBF4694854.1 response regulator [Fusibacter ferrireducens]